MLFKLGQTVITRTAMAFCAKHAINPAELLARHSNGDWGQLSAADNKANVDAIAYDDRILSVYVYGNESPTKLYIITEWDRSITTLLLSSEY
jgi:hypothetical protein